MTEDKHTCYDCVSFDIKRPKNKTQRCAKDHMVFGTDEVNTFCKGGFIPREGGMIMDEIRKKYDTHIVFKVDDLREALANDDDLRSIYSLQETVREYRQFKGKTTEGYLVINRDETYAPLLQEWILWFERMKQTMRPVYQMTVDGQPVEMPEEIKKQLAERGSIIVPSNVGFEIQSLGDKTKVMCIKCWKLYDANLHSDNTDCPYCKSTNVNDTPPVNHARCPKCSHDYDIHVYAMCPKCCDEKEKEYCKRMDEEAEARLERKERMMEELGDAKEESGSDEHPSEN